MKLLNLIIILFLASYPTILVDKFIRSDFTVISSFMINGILWIIFFIIEVKKYAYSIVMMHWTFCFFFFFIAPLNQYFNNIFPWVGVRTDYLIFSANIILFIWTISFWIGTHLRKSNYINFDKNISIKLNQQNLLTIFSFINIIIMIYRVYSIGFFNILSRGTSGIKHTYLNSSSMKLLFDHCIFAFCVLMTMLTIKLSKKYYIYFKLAVINFLCLIIAYFPTSMPRYATATAYGSIIIIMFPNLKKNRIFIILFTIAFLIILPFLNAFRYAFFFDVDILNAVKRIISNMSSVWLAGDYDAYTIITMAIEYLDNKGIVWGRQFLGVLLFWFPRALWPNKPAGSGHFLAISRGWSFTNISCPPPAEGLINFGIVGVIITGIFLGFMARTIDNKYWKHTFNPNSKLEIIYPVIMFMSFFMSRGDLMSSLAYLMAFIIVWFLFIKLSILYEHKNKETKNKTSKKYLK